MSSTHSSLSYHLVFSTKNRERMIHREWRQRLFDMFGGCFRQCGGVLLESGGTDDHVHLLAGLKPTHRISDVMRDIKRATSEWAHDVLAIPHFQWQEGYGAFSVNGPRCPKLVQYIRGQEEHHRKKTFQDEYREFLNQYGIEFDERYLW